MKVLKKLLIISLLALLNLGFNLHTLKAQLFYHPQAPLSVKWRQINSPYLKLVYSTELQIQAPSLAAKIQAFQPYLYQDLKPFQTTYPTLLHNRGTQANAFVQLAPQVSQFYTTPGQGFDSQNWLTNLAIHELRHMAQFDKLAKPKKYPLLQELQLTQIALRIPMWLLEGDAVFQESFLTQAGRGKQPQWIMPFRTAILSNHAPSYSQAFFGSHKVMTPGYYQLGYLMQSLWVQEKGLSIIPQLFEELSKPKLELFNFSKSLKRVTGKTRTTWYTQNLKTLKNAWEHQANTQTPHTSDILSPSSKFGTDYLFPFPIDNHQILCLKQGKTNIPSIVVLDDNQIETHLLHIGFQESPWIHYAAGKVVWVEYRTNPRYRQENYSVLCIYDLKSKEKRQISFKSRYFSPSLSNDGKKIIVVENDLNLQSNIIEIETSTGTILSKHQPLPHSHLENPSYDVTGKKIVFVSVNDSGKSLHTLQLDSSISQPVLIYGPVHQQLSNPKFNGGKIYFNAHLNGIDNIYQLNPINQEIVALSASKYGTFHAQLDSTASKLFFSDYSYLGHRISQSQLQEKPVGSNNFVNFATNHSPPLNDSLLTHLDVAHTNPETYPSTAYPKFQKLFNFHSLSLISEKANQIELIIRSENLLNTIYWENGISYDNDLRKIGYRSEMSVRTFYPILNFRFDNRGRASYESVQNKAQTEIIPTNQLNTWRENRLKVALNLPLNFNYFHRQFSLNLETSTFYTQRYNFLNTSESIPETIRFPMSYSIGFTHAWRRSIAEIAPKFAQSFRFKYFHQPFSKHLDGDLWALESSFYFPGFAPRHSFSLHGNIQRESGIWQSQIEIQPIYGYYHIPAKESLKQVLLMHYKFPLAFPDWEIKNFAFFKQFNLGIFNHYENPHNLSDLKNPKTFGLELNTKVHLFNYQPLFDIGTRIIFVNQSYKQNPILEFTFNYSL
ncbi:MAG: hypothetical protein EOO99_03465 [Pedobacter sp.]|nr:MAG: hypothetical protein EOO99_03465 [Pedobacter sp.]